METEGRIMAIDYGLARVGVAVSDPLGMFATGLPTLVKLGAKQQRKQFDLWVKDYAIHTVVVGLPKHMDGSEGEQAVLSREFAENWQARYPQIKVVLWDERLTSRMAEQTLRELGKKASQNKADVDQLSAIRLLQEYLDSRCF